MNEIRGGDYAPIVRLDIDFGTLGKPERSVRSSVVLAHFVDRETSSGMVRQLHLE